MLPKSIRRRNFKVVTDRWKVTGGKNGWTYFLLSNDGKYAKIGKTKSNFRDRERYANNNDPYRGLQLKLLFAIDDERLEPILHNYFRQYHARYYVRMREYKHLDIDLYTTGNAYRLAAQYNQDVDKMFGRELNELFKFPCPLSGERTLSLLTEKIESAGYKIKRS